MLYKAIFLEVAARINLMSEKERRFLDIHLADSLAPANMIGDGKKVVDWGSGGGLPGIPLAVARPDIHMTLVESVKKKAAFLLKIKRKLGLGNLSLFAGRGEELTQTFDLIVCRAVGRIADILPMMVEHLNPDGGLLFYKGPGLENELRTANSIIRNAGFKIHTDTVTLPSGRQSRYLLCSR